MTRPLLWALPLAAALLAPLTALAEPSAIYIVRHAEKASEGKDPGLTAQGESRARNIGTILAQAGITHIFSSPTTRTRATAAPLAERTGVTVETYDPRAPQLLADKVHSLDGAVLIVGHSNTVPALVRLFGGAASEQELPESEYSRLYQLTPGPAGQTRTVLLTSPP